MAQTLWAWNGTDTSQFESTPSLLTGTAPPNSATFAIATAVDADAPGGRVLRWVYDAADLHSPSLAGVWLINDLFDTTAYPTLVVTMRIRVFDLDGSTVPAGPFIGGETGSALYGYSIMAESAQDGAMRVENGSHVYTNSISANNGSVDNGAKQLWTVRFTVDAPGASEPRVAIYGRGRSENSASTPRAGSSVIVHTDFPSRPVGAAWNSVPMNRIGLAVHKKVSFGGGSFQLDLTDFRVETP